MTTPDGKQAAEGFVKVASVRDVPERGGTFIRIDDDEIGLFKVGEKYYAISNVCAHQHISALHQGEVEGLTVTCPMHGWRYSLETGKALAGSGAVRTYEVKIERGQVWIERPKDR